MREDSEQTEANADPAAEAGSDESGFERAVETSLVASLNLVIIPVVALVLAALGAFVYGVVVFGHSAQQIFDHPFPVGKKVGLFLLDIDLFLIGATLLIAAIGFYELFVGRIRSHRAVRVPPWLQMSDLNDLKARVISMLILVAAVSFVELAVDSPNSLQLLQFGGGVATVIVALTIFLRFGPGGSGRG
jgi:uncharacterized membrane protein YqhA